MTKDKFLQLVTSKEMWEAIVACPELRSDAEVIRTFNEKRADEFKKNVTEAFGSFDPAVHYDWNKKQT